MKTVAFILLGITLAVGVALLYSVPVWWLWNWLMPSLFGLPVIGWLQALGLCVLCSLLLKSSSFSLRDLYADRIPRHF